VELHPRYTVAINFRHKDKLLLDALVTIARDEGNNVTSIFREAIAEFVKTRARSVEGKKLDDFLNDSAMSNTLYARILTPSELRGWSDQNLLDGAKLVRSRKEELDSELRRRGFFFKW